MRKNLAFFVLACSLVFSLIETSLACGEKKKNLQATIVEPWVRSSTGATSAVFMRLKTSHKEGDVLLKAQTDVCDAVELHEHIKEGDIMRMRPVKNIAVASDQETVLQPGGLHIMLIGLKKHLKETETIPVQLHFQKAGKVDINVPVKNVSFRPKGSQEPCNCPHKKAASEVQN